MTPEARRSPGWYDDEADAALLRYWDGVRWSPHTAAKPADAAADAFEQTLALFGAPTATAPTATVPTETVPTATMTRRAPDEQTTVPLPPEPDDVPPRRARRWRVGGGR